MEGGEVVTHMTNQTSEMIAQATLWCTGSGYEVTGTDDGAVDVRTTADTLPTKIRRGLGAPERLELSLTFTSDTVARVAANGDAAIEAVLSDVAESRPGLVGCRADPDDHVSITTTVFVDGANRHTVLTALDEITKTRQVVESALDAQILLASITSGLEAHAAAFGTPESVEPSVSAPHAASDAAAAPPIGFCPNCGHAGNAVDRFCRLCGKPLTGNRPDE